MNIVTCDSCGVREKRTEVYTHTGWWHFTRYKTDKGNVYNGLFCVKCSDKVYAENNKEK